MATLSQEPVEYRVGDQLRLRKPHPCGGYEWTVFRIGADIGISCGKCNRRMLMSRRDLERRTKLLVARGPELTFSPGSHIARLGGAALPGDGDETG